ncbi:hypothetical protein F511_13179 [Dorcoceras hygrometricum]|uniref:Uncharacterized protein n=1 Tax=Dorcoceras hygrometricum TaxID=472368 RepID=A0A2Z7BG27_9LAMI|nr:hypothetical protein F511_13179 [Dorcoceras hygrometricum]
MLRSRRWYELVARDTGTSRKRNQLQEKPVASKPVARETSRKKTSRKRNQSRENQSQEKPVNPNKLTSLVKSGLAPD